MIIAMNPIILFVKDFETSLSFYRNILGLKMTHIVEPHEDFATFDVGGTVFALHGGFKGKVGEGNVALHFVVKNINAEVKKLKMKGVKFTKRIKKMPWGAYQTSFLDPDGNEMDIIQHPKGGPVF